MMPALMANACLQASLACLALLPTSFKKYFFHKNIVS